MNVEYVLPALSWSLSSVQEAGRFTTALRLIIATDINAGNSLSRLTAIFKICFPRNIFLIWRPRPLLTLCQVPIQCPHVGVLLCHSGHTMWMWQWLLLFGHPWPVCSLLQMQSWWGHYPGVWPTGKHAVPNMWPRNIFWGTEEHQTLSDLHKVLWQWSGDPSLHVQLGHTLHGWVVRKTEKEHWIFIGQDWWYSVFVLLLRKTHEKTHNNNKLIPLRLI